MNLVVNGFGTDQACLLLESQALEYDPDLVLLVVYVSNDILDITLGRTPRFVKNFQAGSSSPLEAIRAYVEAVKDRSYPEPEHCFS